MTHSFTKMSSFIECIAEVHRIATCRELTTEDATAYFHDPHRLAGVVLASGVMENDQRRARLEDALGRFARQYHGGSSNGL